MAIGNYDPKKGILLNRQGSSLANNSGQGPNSPVLDIISKEFNWGAFLLNWIWGIGNKTFLPLLVFLTPWIPFVGSIITLGLCVWFGLKGNTWAWQNKQWNNIEHFQAVQKKWAIAGIICSSIITILIIGFMIASLFAVQHVIKESEKVNEKAKLEATAQHLILKSSKSNSTFYMQCDGTSEGLASYFAQGFNGSTFKGNEVKTQGYRWFFGGDGACKNRNDCWVKIYDSNGMNATIPLTLKDGQIIPFPEQ